MGTPLTPEPGGDILIAYVSNGLAEALAWPPTVA